jgi:hypothetical protein
MYFDLVWLVIIIIELQTMSYESGIIKISSDLGIAELIYLTGNMNGLVTG